MHKQNDRLASKYCNICEISRAHMTNEGFQGKGKLSGGSWCSGMSLAHIAHGMCNRAKDAASPFVVGPDNNRPNGITTTGGRTPKPHSHHSPHIH